MSKETKIEWADVTFNPWIGCTKISPGCVNCYAEARDRRFSGGKHWGKGAPRQRTSAATWKNLVKWNEEIRKQYADALEMVYDGSVDVERPTRRVFPSLCDWLDGEVLIKWLSDFLQLIHDTPNLDWLLLTKRPELFEERLLAVQARLDCRGEAHGSLYDWIDDWLCGRAPQNVWIGTSVEDQKRAEERMPEIVEIPAAVKFLSLEPLLGPIDLAYWLSDSIVPQVQWIIVGGESGPKARPCSVDWIRSVVRQCKVAGVPCFVKQLGSRIEAAFSSDFPKATKWRTGGIGKSPEVVLKHPKGGDPDEWPEDLRVREFPRAGINRGDAETWRVTQ